MFGEEEESREGVIMGGDVLAYLGRVGSGYWRLYLKMFGKGREGIIMGERGNVEVVSCLERGKAGIEL